MSWLIITIIVDDNECKYANASYASLKFKRGKKTAAHARHKA